MSHFSPSSRQKKILVIDDDEDILYLISSLISELNIPDVYFSIETANNGRVGFELLKETKFDLVITDLRMPDLPGDHLITLIRNTVFFNQMVPVILISGYLKDLAKSPTINHLPGSLYILEKPVEPDDLEQVIQIWLGDES